MPNVLRSVYAVDFVRRRYWALLTEMEGSAAETCSGVSSFASP